MLPSNFPAQPGPARDAVILQAIQAGNYEIIWSTITSSISGHTATFRVFADALKIGGVRITTSAYLEQTIADLLGCSLLTAKLADLIFAQRAITVLPHIQTPDATMVSTAVMIAQSAWIDSQIPTDYQGGIVSTVGKHWIISSLFSTNTATAGKAINYGWPITSSSFQGTTWPKSATLPNVWVIQNPGWAHDDQEVDYSQNCVLVARDCIVDNNPMDLQTVLQDPVLSYVANADGPLKVLRQPGVPINTAIVQPPCVGPNCPENVISLPSNSSQSSLAPIAIVMGAAGFFGGLALNSKNKF